MKITNLIISLLFLISSAPAQVKEISSTDWLITGSSLGLAAGLELFGKDHWVPTTPRFHAPNEFDRKMRERIWSGKADQDAARSWSDRLIYGISLSSLLWGPTVSKHHALSLQINARVFSVNSIVTNL